VTEDNINDAQNTNHFYLNIFANIQHKNELINTTFKCTAKLWRDLNEIKQIYISPVYPGEIQCLLGTIPFTFKVSMEQELLEVIKVVIVGKLNINEKNIEFSLG